MGKKSTKSKTNKTKDEKQEYIPGSETEEQFEKVLALLSDWTKAGIVDVKIDTDGDVNFDLPSEMDELLGTQIPHDLTHEEVVLIIKKEIPALISAGFEKKKELPIRFLNPEESKEKIELMLERSKKTISRLVNKNIEERILLRRETPVYIVDKIRSMESTYHVESEKGEKIDVPHLSLELTFTKPRSQYMMIISPKESSVSFSRKDDIKVMLDLHQDDIKDLVNRLKEIEEKFFG